MSAIIDLINSAISKAVNKDDIGYKSIIGDRFFTPSGTITQSSDYNCGAAANELEWARHQMSILTASINPNNAGTDLLDMIVMALIALPRETTLETDADYLKRFNMIVRQDTNPTRCTRSAIHDAITEMGLTDAGFHLIERFPIKEKYFELRLIGTSDVGELVLFIDNMEVGYIDNNYMGGIGVGSVMMRLMYLINRIKAGGVQVTVTTVDQNDTTRTSNATITT